MKLIASSLMISMTIPAAATECVGHRGNGGEELENSYSALESAHSIGVPYAELDIHHTRDGIAILSHDDKLRRVATDKPGRECAVRSKISELSAGEITENCLMRNGDEIALLDEVLARFEGRETGIFLELKDVPNDRTLNLVRTHYSERPDGIRLISKDLEALAVARDYLGDAWRYFHVHRSFRSLSLDFDGILNRRADRKRLADLTTEAFSTGTYTINDAEDMLEYRDAGISYVISDYPRLCMQTLNAAD